jgi:hypothetical protein
MEQVDWGKEAARAGIAAVVAFLVGLLLKSLGAGKWVVGGASGAIGGIAAVAAFA